MNKQEVYYKFIFPTYNNLSGSDSDSFPSMDGSSKSSFPTWDGKDQTGEVRALCRKCPERVITYDQLTASNPISMYANETNGWTSTKKNTIKSYIDAWLNVPKYFNLRNYEDSIPTQRLGMSLMVSHTPEVGNTYGDWTKLRVNGKTVYFSLMVSSGDFFYGFTLPDKVIEKSGLRDTIVSNKFHDNWYLKYTNVGLQDTNDEKTRVYCYTSTIGNPHNHPEGAEKRVFVSYYFVHGNVVPLGQVYDDNGDLVNLHWQESDPEYTSSDKREYNNQVATRNYIPCDTGDLIGLPYGTVGSVPTKYSEITEDLKRDFIDLEATRRILYYHDGTRLYYDGSIRDIHPTRDIPRIKSGYGFNTLLSYQPPDEYVDAIYTYNGSSVRGTPPLQIPYDLLRYCLNDRPPFTDCETVLVMWVADSGVDPDDIAENDVAALHGLNWQQYAIPMSIRCCYKQPINSEKFSKERFLVSYPYKWDIDKTPHESTYRFHIRCNEAYEKNEFKEALYMRDLIEYSKDYVITYQYTGHSGTVLYDTDGDGIKETSVNYSDVFNVQKHLLKNALSSFKKLYAKKGYASLSNNHQQQAYYLAVPDDTYRIVTDNARLKACFCTLDTDTDTLFAPSTILTRENHKHWDFDDVTYEDEFGSNDWHVEDSRFIALFDASSFETRSGTFELAAGLREFLRSKVPTESWDDIYLSSLGFTNSDQMVGESLMTSRVGCTHFSIGFLDKYIMIGGTTYGSTINNTVVVGFKYLLDSKYEGLYHFHYDGTSYKSVISTYNSNTKKYDLAERPVTCTAYVIKYS